MAKGKVNRHKTFLSGTIIALVGAAQMGLPQLQVVVSPIVYGVVGFVLGLLVTGIGAYNTLRERWDAEEAAAAVADDPTDQAGA